MSDIDFIPPSSDLVKRVLLIGSMTRAWYDTTDHERETHILPAFKDLVREWENHGARPLATLDDDLLMVGETPFGRSAFYLLFDIDDFGVVVDMIQAVREGRHGIHMDKYVRFEARVGRPFFLIDEKRGSS